MKKEKRAIALTIFLLKERIKDVEAIDTESKGQARSVSVELDGKQIGTLHVKQNPEHPPGWAKFFDGAVDLKARELRAASVSAILLIRTAGRLFALSFGHGRHMLSGGCYEERFGLRVTLNSINPDELRAVDVTTLEANPFHAKHQAARAAPLGEFGLNLDQDLLRGVTGKPSDEKLGMQMAGTDSLSVRARVDLRGLRPLLAKYLEKSQETTYRKRFPWVDHVAEIRDSKVCDQLFDLVVKELSEKQPKHVWAAIPDAIDWTLFDHFQFGAGGEKITHDDITLEKLLQALDGAPPSFELLKRKRVFCVAKGSSQPANAWTFLHCLTAELQVNGETSILNAGAWYRISRDYVKQVDDDVKTIASGALPLTDWGDENEGQYNERMVRKSKGALALMDKVMVSHQGMASPIEFCDLYSKDRKLIHVKRYGQSSVLSHLFAQGLVSATSMLSDQEFRKAANKKLPDSHKFSDPEQRVAANEYEVCFAIGSADHGQLALPFFSRVTLRNTYRALTQLHGFKVSLTKITVSKLTDLKQI